jgi:hypothetical protein
LENFDEQEWEDIMFNRQLLKNAEVRNKLDQQTSIVQETSIDIQTNPRKMNMIDLELALFHMFRQEIPLLRHIRDEAYNALVQWLLVLTKVSTNVINIVEHRTVVD